MANTATRKVSIELISFTIEGTAHRINENGTLSGIKVTKVTGPRGTSLKVAAPPMAGGAMYLKSDTMDGIKVVEATETATVEKKKLF